MFECLGLVESNWVLCKLYLRVLGSLCNGVLSQNYQRDILLGHWVLFLFVGNFVPIYHGLGNFVDSDLLDLYWIFKVVVDSTEKSQVSLKRFV